MLFTPAAVALPSRFRSYFYEKTLILSMIVAMLSGCSIFQRDADAEALSLKTKLSAAAKTFRKDSVMLSFTIINATNQTQRFCKWDTPFDPGIGKYMGISDAQGKEPPFIGAMARRVMLLHRKAT